MTAKGSARSRSKRHDRRPQQRPSGRGKILTAAVAAVVIVALLWPVAVAAGSLLVLAWLAESARKSRAYKPQYSVSSYKELHNRADKQLWGRPGSHAMKLAWGHSVRGWTAAITSFTSASVSTWYAVELRHTSWTLLALVALAAVAAGGGAAQWRPAPYFAAAGRARAGARQESLTLEHIVGLDCVAGVICGWMPPGRIGDLDAAAVLQSGVIAGVETKTGSGRLRLVGDTIYAGDKTLPGDPIAQIHKAATAAKTALAAPVLPIVCVPRSSGKLQHSTGVWVVGGGDLPALLEWANAQPLDAPEPQTTIRKMT